MAKIKRFRLARDCEEHIRNIPESDATYIAEDVVRRLFKTVRIGKNLHISISIGFPADLSKWNDYDYVLVLDEEFLQPYTPFYEKLRDPEWEGFDFLNKFIDEYNVIMSGFEFLEEVTDG